MREVMTTLQKIREIIAATLEIDLDAVDETTEHGSIPQWDSLGHVNILVALEADLDLVLEAEDFERLTSVAAIVAFAESVGSRPS